MFDLKNIILRSEMLEDIDNISLIRLCKSKGLFSSLRLPASIRVNSRMSVY